MPSEQDERDAAGSQFVAALGAWAPLLGGFSLLVPGSLGFMGVTQRLGTHSTAVFTATLISMMSIAVGVQTGLLLWRAAIQLTAVPHRRALHD